MTSAVRNPLKSVFLDPERPSESYVFQDQAPPFSCEDNYSKIRITAKAREEFGEMEHGVNRTRVVSDNAHTMSDVRCQDYP